MILEAIFAVIAGSQSMLEDAEAMSVDALTYLFNLWAEKFKHRPYTAKELALPANVREYHREKTRLYLELVPPFLSVSILIVVTVLALRDAFESLNQPPDAEEDDVDVNLMLIFSGMNLILDIVNVTCFARAHQAFGLSEVKKEHPVTRYSARNSERGVELESLVTHPNGSVSVEMVDDDENESDWLVNLNMCSAWTVRFDND